MQHQESVLTKWYAFTKEMIPIISRFPKDKKFLLGDRMQQLILNVMELLIEAYYVPPPRKKECLQRVNIHLEQLRIYLRLCYEFGYYHSNRYKELVEKLNEPGRMVGGWLKSIGG